MSAPVLQQLQAINTKLETLHTDLVTDGIIVAALPPDVACTETNSEAIKTALDLLHVDLLHVDLLHLDLLTTGVIVTSLPSVTCTETNTAAIKTGVDLLHTEVSTSGIKIAALPSIAPEQAGVRVYGTSTGTDNVQVKTDAQAQIIISNPGDASAANQLTEISYLTDTSTKVDTLYSFLQQFKPSLSYTSAATYQQNVDTMNLVPSVTGIFSTYTITPALPTGLAISSSTGVISGMPTKQKASQTYTVQAYCKGYKSTATVTFEILGVSTYYLMLVNTTAAGYGKLINGYELEAYDINNNKVTLSNGVQAYSTVTFPNLTDGNYTTFYTSPSNAAGIFPWVYYSFTAATALITSIKFYTLNNSTLAGHTFMLFNDTFNPPQIGSAFQSDLHSIGMLWKAEYTSRDNIAQRTVICSIDVTSSRTIVTDTVTWEVTVL
jgi:hypothetical protein